MLYRLLADLVVGIHFAFVIFALLGGLMVLRWRWAAWLHLPAAIWAVLIEFAGWICPLTPLENWLRTRGGGTGYETGFVAHYIIPVLYPAGLTRELQIILGLVVAGVNLAIYGWLIWRWRRDRTVCTDPRPERPDI